MARVTIEDCEEKVRNRFDLVMMGAHRARQISAGSPELVDRDNDKNTVIALREIAEGKVATTDLSEALIQSFQEVKEVEVPENFKEDTIGIEIPDTDKAEVVAEASGEETTGEIVGETEEEEAGETVVGDTGGFEDVDESELVD